ncbi:MAG TPA: permease, partial [Ruminococcaceae bacterium]|nr:permease [Oscillospiraceae bacterium]
MNAAFTYSLYIVAAVLLGISFVNDKKKTALSLKRAWKMFINMLPQYVAI